MAGVAHPVAARGRARREIVAGWAKKLGARSVVGIPFWEILKLVLGFDSAQPNRFDSVDAPRLTRVGEWGLGVGRGPRLGSDAEGELS